MKRTPIPWLIWTQTNPLAVKGLINKGYKGPEPNYLNACMKDGWMDG